MAFVSCYFMGTACRGGTVDACFVHNATYMPVLFIQYFVFRTLYGCNPTRGVANKHVSLSHKILDFQLCSLMTPLDAMPPS